MLKGIWGTKGYGIGQWGAKDHVSKELKKKSHTNDRKMEGNMVGKDA